MASLSLMPIKGNTYYIPSPTNIGVYVQNNEATIIDSGLDKDVAKQILKLLAEQGWSLSCIINTHSHADHIGGNAFLCEKTGCQVIASKGEAAFIQVPLLEPSLLYGGYPYKVLKNKFLMAKASYVTQIIEAPTVLTHTKLEIIPLKGHSIDMIGIKTPDNILFMGDSLFPENILTKYSLTYLWDIRTSLETIDALKTIDVDLFVPSHGEPIQDVSVLCDVNKNKIIEIANVVYQNCDEQVTTEDILQRICLHYQTSLNATQYVLLSSTLRSYLSYLYDEGKIETSYENGKLTWIKKA
ncbi:MAG: MBL fold metallo-hydrolase [Firmicutes bacterium HGW-Firmicutes-1]|jgi:glyoxylase-like metal-dependent hydrolase (beta-lactamase superfamily II)|nr:MAG: MBL fold metallo-hydrolase [Firmicutes bacterium HGW-Firmicutes-1]